MKHNNMNYPDKTLKSVAERKNKTQERKYAKHEFCLAMNCSWFKHGTCTLKPGCSFSARQLHHWLVDNGFEIIKSA